MLPVSLRRGKARLARTVRDVCRTVSHLGAVIARYEAIAHTTKTSEIAAFAAMTAFVANHGRVFVSQKQMPPICALAAEDFNRKEAAWKEKTLFLHRE
jgi:DNA invertase Pin-like site-specific DNA recombinase